MTPTSRVREAGFACASSSEPKARRRVVSEGVVCSEQKNYNCSDLRGPEWCSIAALQHCSAGRMPLSKPDGSIQPSATAASVIELIALGCRPQHHHASWLPIHAKQSYLSQSWREQDICMCTGARG
jgi:hypothetical protein